MTYIIIILVTVVTTLVIQGLWKLLERKVQGLRSFEFILRMGFKEWGAIKEDKEKEYLPLAKEFECGKSIRAGEDHQSDTSGSTNISRVR